MQTLEQLREKIGSADALHSVVKTMKAVAAVNIRQYEESVASLDHYHETVERAWQATLRRSTVDGDLRLRLRGILADDEYPDETLVAMALGSDQGMCGQFDRVMSEFVVDHLERSGRSPDRVGLILAGERLRGHLETTRYAEWGGLTLPHSASGLTDVVEQALTTIDRLRHERGVGSFVLFHHYPAGGTSYESLRVPLLPLDLARLEELRLRRWDGPSLPMTPSPTPVMVRSLTRETLFVNLYRGFAASLAAENASRLAAMQAAESSIEERLDALWQTFYRQRQSSITQELLEVVSGFEQAGAADG